MKEHRFHLDADRMLKRQRAANQLKQIRHALCEFRGARDTFKGHTVSQQIAIGVIRSWESRAYGAINMARALGVGGAR